jgi:poly(hydroxyalkanoate) granule-associated protein
MSKTKISKYTPKTIIAGATERVQQGAERVQETAQNVWLAGLGALALAEDEGGKLFKSLVKRGAVIDGKNKKAYSQVMKGIDSKVEVVKETVVEATSGTVNKIEAGLESGMASVMHTFGVPTRSEIQTLTKKVDALTKSVEHKAKSARKSTSKKARKISAAVSSGTPSF